MNLLLDTHVAIWWLENNKRLGAVALAAIANPYNDVWLSAASIWEMSIKAAAGRLTILPNLEFGVASLQNQGFQSLPISFQHAFRSSVSPAPSQGSFRS